MTAEPTPTIDAPEDASFVDSFQSFLQTGGAPAAEPEAPEPAPEPEPTPEPEPQKAKAPADPIKELTVVSPRCGRSRGR